MPWWKCSNQSTLFLCFPTYMDSRNGTRVLRNSKRYLYTGPSCWPWSFGFENAAMGLGCRLGGEVPQSKSWEAEAGRSEAQVPPPPLLEFETAGLDDSLSQN